MITAIQQANMDVFTHALENAPEGGMATTLVAALFLNNQLYIANVGDSRASRINGMGIIQIFHDHSLAGDMVTQGILMPPVKQIQSFCPGRPKQTVLRACQDTLIRISLSRSYLTGSLRE